MVLIVSRTNPQPVVVQSFTSNQQILWMNAQITGTLFKASSWYILGLLYIMCVPRLLRKGKGLLYRSKQSKRESTSFNVLREISEMEPWKICGLIWFLQVTCLQLDGFIQMVPGNEASLTKQPQCPVLCADLQRVKSKLNLLTTLIFDFFRNWSLGWFGLVRYYRQLMFNGSWYYYTICTTIIYSACYKLTFRPQNYFIVSLWQ